MSIYINLAVILVGGMEVTDCPPKYSDLRGKRNNWFVLLYYKTGRVLFSPIERGRRRLRESIH